ncbi:MAG: FAD-binding protein, partial [Candidatus Lokiarchaeota archaeon]|nr:FAD-binding protein [Candidatus Lokiarchaeota archaeon]
MSFIGSKGQLKTVNNDLIEVLKKRFEGEIFYRGTNGYDDARSIWNGIIDNHPSLILKCKNIKDIKKAINFARGNQIKVSIRGGGHNVAGNAIIQNGLVIDLSEMNSVKIDSKKRIAKIQAGATLGDIDKETAKHNLVTPLGVVSQTGIAGLALRGGMGHLMKKFGLTCDNVVSYDIVTFDGKLRKVDAKHNSDLYWVLRGGGVDVGVITSFTMKLYPIKSKVLFIFQLFPAEQGKNALIFLRDYLKSASDELGILGTYMTIPEDENFPESIWGKQVFAFFGVYTGSQKKWESILESLKKFSEPLLDLGGPSKFVEIQKSLD